MENMKKILITLLIIVCISCSTTHHHHKINDNYIISNNIAHSYIDYSDHIVVVIKHKHKLNKHQKKKLKRWCKHNYAHHKKNIKYKFVISG